MPQNRFSSMLFTSLSRHPRISPSDKEIKARVNCTRYLAISPDWVSRVQCRCVAACQSPQPAESPMLQPAVNYCGVCLMHHGHALGRHSPSPRLSLSGGSVCCGSSLITGVTPNVKIAVSDITSQPARGASFSCTLMQLQLLTQWCVAVNSAIRRPRTTHSRCV